MSRRRWTKEEVELLQDLWGQKSYKTIAKKLNRTVIAIKNKAFSIGLNSPSLYFDGITLSQLSFELKISYACVKKWVEEFDLPIVKKCFCLSRDVKCVRIKEFWDWAEKNKNLLNLAVLEENVLIPEPEWVKQKRAADKMNYGKMRRPWNNEDDKLLVSMLKAGCYTYPEIAQRLQRSEYAVNARMSRLGIYYAPKRASNRPWSKEELNLVISMYEKGYGFNTIAAEIGRTAQAITAKLNSVGYIFINRKLYKKADLEDKVL